MTWIQSRERAEEKMDNQGVKQLFSNKQLLRLAVPMMIEQLLLFTTGIVDTMMVSNLGEAAISGVSLIDMINSVVICFFAAIAAGGAVVTSRFIGAEKKDRAQDTVFQLLAVTVVLSTAVMVLCMAFNGTLVRLFFGKIEKDVYESCTTYFAITALSYPFVAIYNSSGSLFRAVGNSKISMYAAVLSNIFNVIGNYVLIYVVGLGVKGAAIATLLSRIISAVIVLVLLLSKKHVVYLDLRQKQKLDFSIIKRIMSIGIPGGIENSIFEFGRLLVLTMIATCGTVQIAANAVANSVDAMGCVVGKAMGLTMLTVIGQSVGTGSVETVKYYVKKCMKMTYVFHILWLILLFAALPVIIKLYSLSPEAEKLVYILVFIHNGLGMALWPMSFAFPNVMRACGDVKYTMIVSVTSMLLSRVVTGYFMCMQLGMGVIGIFIAMCIDWVVRITCFTIRYKSGKTLAFLGKEQ